MPCAFQVDPDWSRLSTQEGSGSCSRLLRLWLALGSEGVGFGSRCLVYLWLMDLWSKSLFLLPRSLSLSQIFVSICVFFFSPAFWVFVHAPVVPSTCLFIRLSQYLYLYTFVYIYIYLYLFISLSVYSST